MDAPVSVKNKNSSSLRAGVALDVGTTTVQAQLIDLDTSAVLETFSAFNEQRIFGADVMSRISAAQSGKLDDLFLAINNQTESILKHFIITYKLPGIEKCVVSGNTVMLHIFCRENPSSMGAAPYTPVFLEERQFKGEEISLSAANITLLPCISAFLGADVAAGLAFLDIMNKGQDALFVDIGTNGEIAVWKKCEKKFYCCSAAAGPCFEEAEISCGLTASAFIDAIAQMKKLSAIDETGALSDDFALTGFPVAEGKIITQKDIRQFQLAKSAIFSGIKTLCKTARLTFDKIEKAFIAGGLGYNLNLESASLTGLYPAELIEKTSVCGNTSLMGAAKCLIEPDFLRHCSEIVLRSETTELAGDKYFAAAFAHNMYV